jgi:hypothetical protein
LRGIVAVKALLEITIRIDSEPILSRIRMVEVQVKGGSGDLFARPWVAELTP